MFFIIENLIHIKKYNICPRFLSSNSYPSQFHVFSISYTTQNNNKECILFWPHQLSTASTELYGLPPTSNVQDLNTGLGFQLSDSALANMHNILDLI